LVKVQLVIDEHGAVRAVKGVGEESKRTEGHLGRLGKQAEKTGKAFGGLKGMIAGGIGAIGLGGLAFGLRTCLNTPGRLSAVWRGRGCV
jgi:hypothetical protein